MGQQSVCGHERIERPRNPDHAGFELGQQGRDVGSRLREHGDFREGGAGAQTVNLFLHGLGLRRGILGRQDGTEIGLARTYEADERVRERRREGQVLFGCEGHHNDGFKTNVRPLDVPWLMKYLGQVSDDQLRAALRATGATADEEVCFTKAIRASIEQLRGCRSRFRRGLELWRCSRLEARSGLAV